MEKATFNKEHKREKINRTHTTKEQMYPGILQARAVEWGTIVFSNS